MYSYIAGDITEAYAAEKREKVTRSMVTLNTGDPARPCILIIFDRVISTNASFKKTWLLHCIQEPEISGTTSVVLRNGRHYRQNARYGGKLIIESLLPKEVSVTKVGGPGREFWIESAQRNYPTTKGGAAEPGAWRIEVSPSAPSRNDVFLHVMTVMDEQVSLETSARLTSSKDMIGASLQDFVVFFSRDGQLLEAAELPSDGPNKAALIFDLMPGLWSVNGPNDAPESVRIDEHSKSVFLERLEGSIALTFLGP
jgi:heparin/heparan-sulfate lyase